jgi:hypothetical protein
VFKSQSRQVKPLRYYLYVSDTKLDMLFEQIEQSLLKRISAEVRVDFKVASLTLRGLDNPGPTRMAKLRVVERFIDAHHHVGTIQEPGPEYFRGQMDMRWGNVQDAVWFQGNDAEDLQCVGLGGSRYHVMGEQPPSVGAISRSALPALLELRFNVFPENPRVQAELPWEWHDLIDWSGDGVFTGFPTQRLVFLAIPLAEAQAELLPEEGPVHVVLGTPLYVAMARLRQLPAVLRPAPRTPGRRGGPPWLRRKIRSPY